MDPESRPCLKCGTDKPLSEFSKARRGKYGRKAKCKACDAARHAAQFIPKQRDEDAERARYALRRTGLKTCTKCGEEKDRSEFSKSRDGKYGPVLHSNCKACQSATALKWFRDNKERADQNRHRWNLATIYGITPDEYLAMHDKQGGVCAICGMDEPTSHGRTGTKFKLSVDHCHKTGRIRGLLCQKCNRAIGLLNDNVGLLTKAIDYLERE